MKNPKESGQGIWIHNAHVHTHTHTHKCPINTEEISTSLTIKEREIKT